MEDCRYVSSIFIYPVKSLGGVALQSAAVLPKGLAMDRRWMLIDEQHKFITQRTLTQLCHFHTQWQERQPFFEISHGGDAIQIPTVMQEGEVLKAEIWEDEVQVVEVSSAISQWFAQRLGMACRLVAFPEAHTRPVDPDYRVSSTDNTSLSDGYPILIIGQASLDDLNARLPERMGMERFRPNIVFENGLPFEEDTYREFSIGSVPMAGVKPCARCVMTTIDPATGHKGKEPLQTLATYRKVGSKILFGQNVIARAPGTIMTGDIISF